MRSPRGRPSYHRVMRPVITPAESARLDEASIEPVERLMDRAGYRVALAAARMGVGYGSRVVALAGPGNNGGDAYVAARYLRDRGASVEVHSLGFPKGDWSPARKAASAAVHAGVRVRPLGRPGRADLLIDGLFGAGFRGSLDGRAAAWVEAGHRVLAIDLPSGLSGSDGSVSGSCFSAERTVTFHALKVGHLLGDGPDLCGEIEVADIGLSGEDPALLLCEDSDAWVPPRRRSAHKWRSGAVLVVGGSPGLEGAAALTGRAALEAGAGYVRVACHRGSSSIVVATEPSLTTVDWEQAASDAGRFDVIAIGPGLGRSDEARVLVSSMLERWDRTIVVDADAISLTSVGDLQRSRADVIITPHNREFERLTGAAPTVESVADLAEAIGGTVVAKGNPTLVIGEERWVITSGGPELATLGTGDVLTGMIAAFGARGLEPIAAARAAAHRHGRAGADVAASGTVTASRLAASVRRWAW